MTVWNATPSQLLCARLDLSTYSVVQQHTVGLICTHSYYWHALPYLSVGHCSLLLLMLEKKVKERIARRIGGKEVREP